MLRRGGEQSLRCAGFSLWWLLLWSTGSRRASVVVARGLSSCGARAQLLRGMWDLPEPGLEPVSPAWAGGFLTTAPPGKSLASHLCFGPTCYWCTHVAFLLLIKNPALASPPASSLDGRDRCPSENTKVVEKSCQMW